MTKEQEEIIQRVNSDIDSPLSGGYTTIVLTDDLEEILNTLKEKDAEINKYKRKNKELSNQLLKIYKEQDNYNARIEKKDKIIDLMAEHICNSAIVDDTVCAIKCDCETDIEEDCTHEKMLICTKQYFERKVEDERKR